MKKNSFSYRINEKKLKIWFIKKTDLYSRWNRVDDWLEIKTLKVWLWNAFWYFLTIIHRTNWLVISGKYWFISRYFNKNHRIFLQCKKIAIPCKSKSRPNLHKKIINSCHSLIITNFKNRLRWHVLLFPTKDFAIQFKKIKWKINVPL